MMTNLVKTRFRSAMAARLAAVVVIGLSILTLPACDDTSIMTGPVETVVVVTVRDNSFDPLMDFVFTQNNDSMDVSLRIQNTSQREILSFNYSINYSVSGRGWVVADSAGPIPIGESLQIGIIARDSPILTQNGFSVTVSSVIFG